MKATPTSKLRHAAGTTRAPRMSPQARRTHLIDCALRAYADKGIGETRHSDLAAAAGVALPTTLHYFPDKQELTSAVLREVSRFLLEDLVAPHYTSAASAPDAIEQILMAFCDAIDSHPHYVRVWLEWSVSIRGALWKSYLGFYRRALAGIGQILERGKRERSVRRSVDVEDAARVIVGLAHMIVQMKFSGSTRAQIVRTVHSLVQGYLERDA